MLRWNEASSRNIWELLDVVHLLDCVWEWISGYNNKRRHWLTWYVDWIIVQCCYFYLTAVQLVGENTTSWAHKLLCAVLVEMRLGARGEWRGRSRSASLMLQGLDVVGSTRQCVSKTPFPTVSYLLFGACFVHTPDYMLALSPSPP